MAAVVPTCRPSRVLHRAGCKARQCQGYVRCREAAVCFLHSAVSPLGGLLHGLQEGGRLHRAPQMGEGGQQASCWQRVWSCAALCGLVGCSARGGRRVRMAMCSPVLICADPSLCACVCRAAAGDCPAAACHAHRAAAALPTGIPHSGPHSIRHCATPMRRCPT